MSIKLELTEIVTHHTIPFICMVYFSCAYYAVAQAALSVTEGALGQIRATNRRSSSEGKKIEVIFILFGPHIYRHCLFTCQF